MRVVVLGATGNTGTSLLAALAAEPAVDSVLGLSRREPELDLPKVDWGRADVRTTPLAPLFRGADAVVHLAWLIQPSRDEDLTEAVNVGGSRRVFEAVAESGVPKLVYASSVGAYSPGPKDAAVDESHPTNGIETSFYARHKARVERLLDAFEREHPSVATIRMRPALIFKADAASGIRRLFAGPLLPNALVRRSLIPIVPAVSRLRFQAVHSLDVGEAYRQAIVRDVSGPFNLAADPVLDPERLGKLLGARPISLPAGPLRAATKISWKLRLQPTPPGWLDMALAVPIMDSSRARERLGWEPRFTSEQALLELLEGLRRGDGIATPPLHPRTGGPLRIRELLTGLGGRAG
jgi:UDP-glucose 4-epimerase